MFCWQMPATCLCVSSDCSQLNHLWALFPAWRPSETLGNPSGPLSGRCVHIVFVDVTLSSSVQALDPSQAGATTHLVYERGEDVIVMKGYKFSRAKLAATAALGCLASSRGAVAEVLAQVGQGS